MKKDLILVTGASGTVGQELTKILREQGYHLRLLTGQSPKNSDSVQVRLETGEGLDQAFEGVTHAFLLSPPGYADQYKLLSPMIEKAKKHQLKKVVLMTAMGANAVDSSPFRRAEIELEKSGIPFNIIRPNWFMQNFNTFWIQGIKEQKKIFLPAGSASVSFIDARDIAAVAAQLLTSNDLNNKAFDLTGPAAINHDQVALAISKATGDAITYQEITPETLKKGLLGAGLPSDYVDFLLMILSYLKAGYNAQVHDTVKFILKREPLSIERYSEDYVKLWKNA